MSSKLNTTVTSQVMFTRSTPIQGFTPMIEAILFLLACSLLLWRLWRFTVSPLLHPSLPREYPSWVPYFGHAVDFFRDSNGLLGKARKHFHNTGDPFALTVLGMTFYVVTQAKHSAEVYRNTENLSFEDFVQGLMKNNGNSDNAIEIMYSTMSVHKTGFPNPQGDSLGVLAQKMHVYQLHPGKNLAILQERVHAWIGRCLSFKTLHDTCGYVESRGRTSLELPLYQWCSDYFVRLGQHVYFGETLNQINPDLPAAFFEFDERIWKMLYQYPGFLSKDMAKPRSQIIDSLKKYFEVPRAQRFDEAAWLINAMEDEAKSIGLDDDNLAIIIFHLYFAINTNTRKTVFWLLTYLIHNPELIAIYRRESAPAFVGPDLIDPSYLQDAVKCPQIDAIWHETLRLSSWSASVRLVKRDTVIGGKLMRQGNRVLVPHRLLHFDEDIFGEEIHAFHPERWQKNNRSRSSSWRPFGGGKTTCSGRFLARYSVTTFVATLLHRFDIELVGDPPFPEADEGRPVLGIMSVKEGQDFRVKLSPRL